jgi:hypothetical protein
MPVDNHLGNMAVMFFDAQDDMRLECAVDHRLDLVEVFVGMFLNCRRKIEVASSEFDFHRAAPYGWW